MIILRVFVKVVSSIAKYMLGIALVLTIASFMSRSAEANLLSEPDKKLHIKASVLAASVFYVYNEYNDNSHWYTLGECMAVGLAKEIYDEISYGGFDNRDLAADAIGCVGGIFLADTSFKVISEDSSVGIRYTFKF